MKSGVYDNPLGTKPIGGLMRQFAIPSIIGMLVTSLYNIVDQLFIGHAVGTLGNAATNIAFPFTTMCIAMALLFGIGGASAFNLTMGEGDTEKAPYYVGNAILLLVGGGTILLIIAQLFLTPLLIAFGAPEEVLPYAKAYVRITSLGFPFVLLTGGGTHLVRADGKPRMSMICNIIGAVINTILDALFVLVFGWGMSGAALATIIGQIVSAIVVIRCLCHFQTVPLKLHHLKLNISYAFRLASLGTANAFNQVAMMIVQVVLNNSLRYYGGQSIYGESIPIACSGIVMKVNQMFFSVVIGISQGSQPIESFNYGAANYRRVRDTYKVALKAAACVCVISFLVFQTIPKQILLLFGTGTDTYVEFGVKFFRIFLIMAWANFLQPLTSNMFTAIGKPKRGIFLSLTRQIIYLLPMIVVLPLVFGINGIIFAAPVADTLAAITSIAMARLEMKDMKRLETIHS